VHWTVHTTALPHWLKDTHAYPNSQENNGGKHCDRLHDITHIDPPTAAHGATWTRPAGRSGHHPRFKEHLTWRISPVTIFDIKTRRVMRS
jgi:hypothetical protein